MGYIEETGVAQHYRDVRIAPIYEGTNGIQAIDLVGRKLGLRGGAVIADFLAGIDATAAEATAAGGELAMLGDAARRCQRRRSVRRRSGCRQHGSADPDDGLAGATPYLRMAGIVTGGWLLTKSAIAADALRSTRRRRILAEFLEQKLVTARFYADPAAAPGRRPAPGHHGRPRRPLRRHPS